MPEITAITGHNLKHVEALLDGNYLSRRVELVEQAIFKLADRYGEAAPLLIHGAAGEWLKTKAPGCAPGPELM